MYRPWEAVALQMVRPTKHQIGLLVTKQDWLESDDYEFNFNTIPQETLIGCELLVCHVIGNVSGINIEMNLQKTANRGWQKRVLTFFPLVNDPGAKFYSKWSKSKILFQLSWLSVHPYVSDSVRPSIIPPVWPKFSSSSTLCSFATLEGLAGSRAAGTC